jgi:hypothetical protein
MSGKVPALLVWLNGDEESVKVDASTKHVDVMTMSADNPVAKALLNAAWIEPDEEMPVDMSPAEWTAEKIRRELQSPFSREAFGCVRFDFAAVRSDGVLVFWEVPQ